jgi:hypothetical protein
MAVEICHQKVEWISRILPDVAAPLLSRALKLLCEIDAKSRWLEMQLKTSYTNCNQGLRWKYRFLRRLGPHFLGTTEELVFRERPRRVAGDYSGVSTGCEIYV